MGHRMLRTVYRAVRFEEVLRSREGWRARWANEKSPDHPGITLRVTDVGDPYTNEDVDQVFAVITPKNGVASIGPGITLGI